MFFDKDAMFNEYNEYYSADPADISHLRTKWHALCSAEANISPFRSKAILYEVASDDCDVHIFRNNPFYYEIKSGRPRNSWGLSGIGMFLRDANTSELFRMRRITEKFDAERLFSAWDFIDWDHQSIGYDNVLKYGLRGLREKAEDRLSRPCSEMQREFLNAVIAAMNSLIKLSNKFADKAKAMLAHETDIQTIKRLELISETAGRIPEYPPSTFYEALNTLLFMREICNSLEGLGISMYGQLDRMLEPYYISDLKAGRITRSDAEYYIKSFLSITDARFDLSTAPETSNTISVGGQDRDGSLVYNELTQIICHSMTELRLTNPKLNARITPAHSDEYFDLLSKTALSGTNNIAIFNDEALIKAHSSMGKAIEDCRIYANGGCQEPMLQNNEVNFKAYIYVNLLRILEMTLYPERITNADREYFVGLADDKPLTAKSWSEFYSLFLTNFKSVIDGISAIAADAGSKAWITNPSPMLSATIDDCIEKGMDMFQGGARYNSASLALNGFGTLLDSLYSIKQLIYNEQKITIDELKSALDNDYNGYEDLREYILKHIPKYGQDNDSVNAFAKTLASDIAERSSGQDNGRGGKFEASLFTYFLYKVWGENWQATPDGRHKGDFFARGINPDEKYSGEMTSLMNSVCSVPADLFPGGCIVDVTLPTGIGNRIDIVSAVIKRFLDGGGSIMQINILNRDDLIDAKLHPERYPSLTVRVCGYSVYFTSLNDSFKDEIIARTLQTY